jgi:hypothetical protein
MADDNGSKHNPPIIQAPTDITPFWRDREAEFWRYATGYPTLNAEWSAYYGWQFIDSLPLTTNEPVEIFRAVASDAGNRLPSMGSATGWVAWLNALRENGLNCRVAFLGQERLFESELSDDRSKLQARRDVGAEPGAVRFEPIGIVHRVAPPIDEMQYQSDITVIRIEGIFKTSAIYCRKLPTLVSVGCCPEVTSPAEPPGPPAVAVVGESAQPIAESEHGASKTSTRRKCGPVPISEAEARHVADIIDRVGPDWCKKLGDVGYTLDHGVCDAPSPEECDDSTHEKIPLPRGWKQKHADWLNPPDDQALVKAIKERLKKAPRKS